MKKVLFLILFLLILSPACFAAQDKIYNTTGAVITGKIDGITDGLIQIKNNGNIVTLIRKEPHHVYKDSVEVRKRLISRQIIKYVGNIIFADSSSVKIICEDVKVVIPRYKVKKMELFVP